MIPLQSWKLRPQGHRIIAALILISSSAIHYPELEKEGKSLGSVFPAGETLVYDIRWGPPAWIFFLPTISAGEITFTFQGEADYKGKPALKMTADAISSGFFSSVAGITVVDSFESFVSAGQFCSLQISKKIREGKRQRDILLTFDSSNGTGHYLDQDASKHPPVELKNQAVQNIPTCVQDLLSAIYYTRTQDFRVGNSIRMAISDNGTVKNVEIKVDKREMVDSPKGQLPALRTEATSVFGGLFRSGGTLLVWVSDDDRRLPLKFEAKIKLGKVFGTIKTIGNTNKRPNGTP
jgi:Protein of unknown function (DUF3108)